MCPSPLGPKLIDPESHFWNQFDCALIILLTIHWLFSLCFGFAVVLSPRRRRTIVDANGVEKSTAKCLCAGLSLSLK